MLASIGFSIFWSGHHEGCNVAGTLEFAIVPAAGDRVSLLAPGNREALPHVGFSGQLRVEQRIVQPGSPGGIVLVLEPVVVDTEVQAQMLRQYFERGFGLVAD